MWTFNFFHPLTHWGGDLGWQTVACREGERWTSTFPTFQLLLFCVVAALRGALGDRERQHGMGGQAEKKKGQPYRMWVTWAVVGRVRTLYLWTGGTGGRLPGAQTSHWSIQQVCRSLWLFPQENTQKSQTESVGNIELVQPNGSKFCFK